MLIWTWPVQIILIEINLDFNKCELPLQTQPWSVL